MYTIAQAAKELHMSIRQVQRLVESGDLKTVGEAPDRLIVSLDPAMNSPRPSFPRKAAELQTVVAGIYSKWPDPPILYPAAFPENPPWRWELAKVQDPVDDDVPEVLANSDGSPWDSKYYVLVRPFAPVELQAGKKLYSFAYAEESGMWEWQQLPDELPEVDEDDEERDYDA